MLINYYSISTYVLTKQPLIQAMLSVWYGYKDFGFTEEWHSYMIYSKIDSDHTQFHCIQVEENYGISWITVNSKLLNKEVALRVLCTKTIYVLNEYMVRNECYINMILSWNE